MQKSQAEQTITTQRQSAAAGCISEHAAAPAIADASELAVAQRRLAQLVSTSTLAVAQRKMIEQVQSSPRAALQKKQIARALDGPLQQRGMATAASHDRTQLKMPPVSNPRAGFAEASKKPLQARQNKTGMPNQLKEGVEGLSGMDLSDVRVHHNSAKPAQLNALAYAQGNDIHLGAGQEKHLPHEAWHVVQQRQGRVKPTLQAKGTPINDDPGLEKEADVMGSRAQNAGDALLQRKEMRPDAACGNRNLTDSSPVQQFSGHDSSPVFQLTTTITNSATKTISNPTDPSETLEVGTGMTAHLDPADPETGSKVSADLSGPLQHLTRGTKRRYVQGHLLNSRAGGAGSNADNLTPLTYSANSTHFHSVEKGVIENLKANKVVDYSVTPDYSGTPTAAALGLESDIERNFAKQLNCSVSVAGAAATATPVTNVPPFP